MAHLLLVLFNVLAGLASIVGLYYAMAATRKAGEATIAANQAKQAVREANAVEELRRLAGIANEMKREIQDAQWRTARLRCDDLAHGISFGKQRWKGLTPTDASAQLESALAKINALSRAIAGNPEGIGDEMRTKLLGVCHDILVRLSSVAGRMQEVVEGQRND
jgi:hypothetical protein